MELKVLEWTFFRECKVSKDIENILVDGESATVVYKTIRDLAVFTNKRLIVKDKQGITGHKSEIFSYIVSSSFTLVLNPTRVFSLISTISYFIIIPPLLIYYSLFFSFLFS